jgi:hypothetical protein
MKLEFSQRFLKNPQDIKLHENPFSESCVVQCKRMDRRTAMTKVKVAFHMPNNRQQIQCIPDVPR